VYVCPKTPRTGERQRDRNDGSARLQADGANLD
jgi:hypothetical protein